MCVLKFILKICMIAGCYQPFSWTLLFKGITYKVYKIILISIMFTFMTSQFMNIVINMSDAGDIAGNLYLMLAVFLAILKIIFMWITAPNVITIIKVLAEKPFIPTESNELTIQRKYDKIIRKNTIAYLTLASITPLLVTLISFYTKFLNGNLVYKVWLPFNYTRPAIFFIVYTHQLISLSLTDMVNVGFDILIFGLLMHICCQLDTLEHRLTRMSHGREILRDCICHHDYIFQYAYRINDQFGNMIGLQFMISALVGCFNLYQLAMSDMETFFQMAVYTFAIYAEIFLYCWFGNEVELKSVQLINGVYNMEWPVMSNNNKMAFLMIMRRSMNPIKFTSAYIISMNLGSFVSLLKVSYSIYNLLQSNNKAKMEIS